MKKTLYLGTDPLRYRQHQNLIHLPLIQIRPFPISTEILKEFDHFTHVLITSRHTAQLLISQISFQHKQLLAIGKGTAAVLESHGISVQEIAAPETQEGMISRLKEMELQKAYLFYPRSSLARPLLAAYLREARIKHQIYNLYETVFREPKEIPPLDEVEEIVFTSPSTVQAFMALYGTIPKNKKLTCIGPVTQAELERKKQEIRASV